MDNLQRHYLLQFQNALQQLLTRGESAIRTTLDLCLELRLKPDLAHYTRVLVNLTICDLKTYEELPEKVGIAADALRLIRELQAQDHPAKDSFWINQCSKLESKAEKVLERAQQEMAKVLQPLYNGRPLEGDVVMKESRSTSSDEDPGSKSSNADDGVQRFDLEAEPGRIDEDSEFIEGNFTLFPAQVSPVSVDIREGSDEQTKRSSMMSITLPMMPKPQPGPGQLATPPQSSQVLDEQD